RGPDHLADAEHTITLSGAAQLAQVLVPVRLVLDLARLPDTPASLGHAARAPLGSRLAWPAGPVALLEAMHRLNAGGNLVMLELGADERRTATMPAFDGAFWDGVLEVCRAFDLTVLPAAPAGDTGSPVPVAEEGFEPVGPHP